MHVVQLIFHILLFCVSLLLSLVNSRDHEHRIDLVTSLPSVDMQLSRIQLVDVFGFAALLFSHAVAFGLHDL